MEEGWDDYDEMIMRCYAAAVGEASGLGGKPGMKEASSKERSQPRLNTQVSYSIPQGERTVRRNEPS
jgi:hypothetical protein